MSKAYLVAHDLERSEPRLVRVDRILGVEVTDDHCTAPVPDSREEVRGDGSVRLVVGARDERRAEIGYSPRVARWVRERYDGEDDRGGAQVVKHRVITDDWVVRHVLTHGAEAGEGRPSASPGSHRSHHLKYCSFPAPHPRLP